VTAYYDLITENLSRAVVAASTTNVPSDARKITPNYAVFANIGVASYGALGHVRTCPLYFQLFNFSGHFRGARTLIFDSM